MNILKLQASVEYAQLWVHHKATLILKSRAISMDESKQTHKLKIDENVRWSCCLLGAWVRPFVHSQ